MSILSAVLNLAVAPIKDVCTLGGALDDHQLSHEETHCQTAWAEFMEEIE